MLHCTPICLAAVLFSLDAELRYLKSLRSKHDEDLSSLRARSEALHLRCKCKVIDRTQADSVATTFSIDGWCIMSYLTSRSNLRERKNSSPKHGVKNSKPCSCS